MVRLLNVVYTLVRQTSPFLRVLQEEMREPSDLFGLTKALRRVRCSEMVLRNWLREVLSSEPEPDGSVHFNLYKQSKTLDIRVGHYITL
jgi:hypothetical protein